MAPAACCSSAGGVSATTPLTASIVLDVPGLTLSTGTFTLAMNTSGPSDTFSFGSTSATLRVGGVSLSGGFAFARTLVDGAVVDSLTLTGVTVTVATAADRRPRCCSSTAAPAR